MDNKYLSDFQIIGSSIKSLKIKNDFILLGDGNSVKRKIDISHCVGDIEKIEEGALLSGTVILYIKTIISDKKKKYTLDLAIEGCFTAPSKMGEETFRNMLQLNGITSLYSISRGFVQSTSSQTLAFGSVLLPMLNVVAYSRDLSEEKESDPKE